jgi:hypothetical protein
MPYLFELAPLVDLMIVPLLFPRYFLANERLIAPGRSLSRLSTDSMRLSMTLLADGAFLWIAAHGAFLALPFQNPFSLRTLSLAWISASFLIAVASSWLLR